MLSVLRTAEQKPACQHLHHEVHEEKKKCTLNTITIGKQLINRIGGKPPIPKHSQSCHCEEAHATRQSSPNRPHKHRHHAYAPRPPPVIASHKVARQSSGTDCLAAKHTPLDCRVGSRRDPPRNDSGISSIERIPQALLAN